MMMPFGQPSMEGSTRLKQDSVGKDEKSIERAPHGARGRFAMLQVFERAAATVAALAALEGCVPALPGQARGVRAEEGPLLRIEGPTSSKNVESKSSDRKLDQIWLQGFLGSDYVHIVAPPGEQDPQPPVPFQIEHHELSGFTLQEWTNVESHLPSQWRRGPVRVTFSKEVVHVDYADQVQSFAECRIEGEDRRVTLAFHDPSLGTPAAASMHTVTYILIHELAHATRLPSALVTDMIALLQRGGYPHFYNVEPLEKQGRRTPESRYHLLDEFRADLIKETYRFGDDDVRSWDEWEDSFTRWLQERRSATPDGAAEAARIARLIFQQTSPGFRPWEHFRSLRQLVHQKTMDVVRRQIDASFSRIDDIRLKVLWQGVSRSDAARAWSARGGYVAQVHSAYSEIVGEWDRLMHAVEEMKSGNMAIALEGSEVALQAADVFLRAWHDLPKEDRAHLIHTLSETVRASVASRSSLK